VKITLILSCLATALTEPQRAALAARVEWVVVNRRLGRVLLDVIGERANLQWVVDQLTTHGLDPIVCAAFRFDTGQRINSVPINLPAYLAVAPDVQDFTNPQVPVWVRPTTYATRHKWLGWPDHNETPEP